MQEEVHPNIEALSFIWEKTQGKVEAYLLKGRVNAVIDTGPPQVSFDATAPVLRGVGLTPDDVGLILHTHGHQDHTGGTGFIKAVSGAPIHLHREDALFLEDHERCFDQFNAPLIRALGEGKNSRKKRRFSWKRQKPRSWSTGSSRTGT